MKTPTVPPTKEAKPPTETTTPKPSPELAPMPTPTPTPKKKEIHHEGDLVIEGNQSYVIEDVTFFQDGNIIVKDSAKLIIRNVEVIVNSTYPWRYWVRVRDNASLTVKNSLLQTYAQMFLWLLIS